MGSIWVNGSTAGYPNVVDVLRGAGLNVVEYEGWRNRSRSSGGFSGLWGVLCHHTASQTSPASDLSYMVYGSPDAPVSNGLLDRTGTFTVIAGGASNHGGKGGGSSDGGGTPWVTSKGTIPGNSANSYAFGIEAANNGVGEPWPQAQQDAYVVMVRALTGAYGLNPMTDVRSHHEWTPPRKIDPRGPSRWQPANSSTPWDMHLFRAEVGQLPAPPIDIEDDDDMARMGNPLIQSTGKDGAPPGAVFLTDGRMMTFRYIPDPQTLSDVQFYLRGAGLSDQIQACDNMDAYGVLVGHVPQPWSNPPHACP